MLPHTRYAKSGEVNIAYQVLGQGPLDLVYIPGWVSNIEIFWEEPAFARFLTRLASFCRLILFDKRGTGLSDRAAVSGQVSISYSALSGPSPHETPRDKAALRP